MRSCKWFSRQYSYIYWATFGLRVCLNCPRHCHKAAKLLGINPNNPGPLTLETGELPPALDDEEIKISDRIFPVYGPLLTQALAKEDPVSAFWSAENHQWQWTVSIYL